MRDYCGFAQVLSKKKELLIILLIFIFSIAAYFNSFSIPFLFDDISLIVENQDLKNFKNIFNLFAVDFFQGKTNAVMNNSDIGYYRPIISISYYFDYFIWRLNAVGYHITNFGVHFLNALLFFYFVKLLFADFKLAVIAALIFSIHPLHTESVSWISGRTDVIAVFFILLTLIAYILYIRNSKKNYLILSLCFFICALLAKEISAIVPFIIIALNFKIKNEKLKIKYWQLAFFAVLIAYGLIRFFILDVSLAVNDFKIERFYSFIILGIPYYLKKIFLPFNLNVYLHYELLKINYIAILFLASVLIFVIALLIKYRKKIDYLILFSLFFFTISLLPISNILPISLAPDYELTIAERFMYLPSIPLILIVSYFLTKIPNTKIFYSILVFIFVALICLTIIRNREWQSEERLLNNALIQSPNSLFIINRLANIYKNNGEYQKAIDYYLKIYNKNPRFYGINNNLGAIFMELNDYQKSFEYFNKELEYYGDNAIVYNNIGLIFINLKKYEQALHYIGKAIKLQPDYAYAYNNFGVALINLRKYDDARKCFEYAIKLAPEYQAPRDNLKLLDDLFKKNQN